MKRDNILIDINNKRIRYNILKFITFSMILGFSLIGTVSIVSLLIYLYQCYSVSFFGCLTLDIILPYIYSLMIKGLMKPVDTKLKNISLEIEQFEDMERIEQEKEKYIKKIKIRLDNLSISNQIIVLNFIKDNCLVMIENVEQIDKLSMNDMMIVMNELNKIQGVGNDSGYSRKRMIDIENNKKM